jgi:hypothetical protein
MGKTEIFCPNFYIFRLIWTQFGKREDHKSLFSDREFRENRCGESHNTFKGVYEFISVLYTGCLHIMLFSFGEFHQKRRREGLNFCYRTNKITFTLVP